MSVYLSSDDCSSNQKLVRQNFPIKRGRQSKLLSIILISKGDPTFRDDTPWHWERNASAGIQIGHPIKFSTLKYAALAYQRFFKSAQMILNHWIALHTFIGN